MKINESRNKSVQFSIEVIYDYSEENAEILYELFENADDVDSFEDGDFTVTFGWDEDEARYVFEEIKKLPFVETAVLHFESNEGGIITGDEDLEVYNRGKTSINEEENIEDESKQKTFQGDISEITNIIFDTLFQNKQYPQLDLDLLNEFDDEIEDFAEVDAKNGVIRFGYDGHSYEINVNKK